MSNGLPRWVERTVFLEYGDEIADTKETVDSTDVVEALGDWESVDAAVEQYSEAVRDRAVDWAQSWKMAPGEEFEDFYAREIDSRTAAEGGDSYTLSAAEEGDPMNCLSRAVSGAIMAELTGKDDLAVAVGWDDGADLERGTTDPGRAHVLLTEEQNMYGDRPVYGQGDVHADGAALTVTGPADEAYDNAELMDTEQLVGLYVGSMAYDEWHDGRADVTSEVYAPMIDEVAGDSDYLSRQSEQADQDFYIA